MSIKGSGGGCFPAGVMVLTPSGQIAIEDIRIGDEVLSFSYDGVVEVSTVLKIFKHEALPTISVNYWGGILRATSNHWVLNQYNTFAEIGTLTELDAIVDQLGHLRPIISITEDSTEPVYNLHVSKNHTFIADGIRVHNGGLGLKTPIIGSGGGGGKGGGGSSVPTEADDSLQSKQYAKVVDLISEGEIEGLVGGAQGIFLDNTPLQNSDGSYNFSGFSYHTRNGTQDQTAITGFDEITSEKSVGVRIVYGTPVVRQITNQNIDYAVVTVAIPALSSTDVSNGNVSGTSVALKIEVQSNGGGYVGVPIRYDISTFNFTLLSDVYIRMPQSGSNINFTVLWNGAASSYYYVFDQKVYTGPNGSSEYITYTLQKRNAGSSDAWVTVETNTFSGNGYWTSVTIFGDDGPVGTDVYVPATVSKTYNIPDTGTFEFQLVIGATSSWGYGVFKFSSSQAIAGNYVSDDTISGKASSRYQRSYKFPLLGTAPWDIRVTRLTADSTTQYLQNQTWFDSYTEVINSRLRYPNSALVAVSIDSSQFSSIPSRGFLTRGVKIKVPDNYDPLTRVYTGVWLGGFKTVWSDNPAWVFYDLVTNTRYGLGEFVSESMLDIGTLYQIGQYCDELVPNGYGGVEPRYTCNMYLQSREEAFHVLASIASIFSGMVYWSNGLITATADKPSDKVYQFTNANVIDGHFEYQGSSQSSRHTVALVAWNDPNDRYVQKVEYVEDAEGIVLYGVKETEVLAVGCTSRGQAHRMGKRILLTERYLTETVTFKTGLEAVNVYPGAIIGVQDNNRSGGRFGGRIKSATINTVTLDSSIVIEAGITYFISVILPDGTIQERTVLNSVGSYTVITVTADFTAAPEAQSMWVISSSSMDTQLFMVLGIKEADKTTWDINAIQYNPSKFAAIDADMQFEPLSISSVSSTLINPPSNLVLTEQLYKSSVSTIDNKLVVSWTATDGNYLSHYVVSWRYQNDNWNILPDIVNTQVEIAPILNGTVEVSVVAVNLVGIRSSSLSGTKLILGKSIPPQDISTFNIQVSGPTSYLTWNAVTDLDIDYYEIRFTPVLTGGNWNSSSVLLTNIAHPTVSAVVPTRIGTYLIKAVDTSGNMSANALSIVSNVSDISKLNSVATLTEHSTFLGSKVNTAVIGSNLQLEGSFMSTWGYLSTLSSMYVGSGLISTGEYYFDNSLDLGQVYTSKVTSKLFVYGSNINNVMSGWEPLSVADPLSGTSNDTWNCVIEIRTTNDDPTGTPVWSPWTPTIVGDYTCRAYEFRTILYSYTQNVTPVVEQLEVTIDMPDRVDGGNDIVCTIAGLAVTYSPAFKVAPALAIAAQGLTTGDYYDITSKSSTGFTIIFKNSSGTPVERTFDWVAKGYGYVI